MIHKMRKPIILLSILASASAWTTPQPRTSLQLPHQLQHEKSFDPTQLSSDIKSSNASRDVAASAPRPEAVFFASSLPIIIAPAAASAATAFTDNAVPSALTAYGHYFALLGILGCIMAERLTIKPNMT